LHGTIRFLAIQNGVRILSRDSPPEKKRIFHSEFACFGEHDVSQFKKSGAEVLYFYPVGSLKDSYYRSYRGALPLPKQYDLCLVSQIKPQHYKHYPKTMKSLELLANHLKRFCDTHNTSLCVAARREPGNNNKLYDWEVEWYRRHLGDHINIIPNDSPTYNSYSIVDASRVTLALHSSMIHEAFGRGRRLLACNFTGDDRYEFPINGIWRLSDSSYEDFELSLLRLLNISDEDYSELAGKLTKYLIRYDREYPTHIFLKELIAEAVSGLPAPFITPRIEGKA
jgi:surface carbohydrate biosynthesis protein